VGGIDRIVLFRTTNRLIIEAQAKEESKEKGEAGGARGMRRKRMGLVVRPSRRR
jgi:hypothetical protein